MARLRSKTCRYKIERASSAVTPERTSQQASVGSKTRSAKYLKIPNFIGDFFIGKIIGAEGSNIGKKVYLLFKKYCKSMKNIINL